MGQVRMKGNGCVQAGWLMVQAGHSSLGMSLFTTKLPYLV